MFFFPRPYINHNHPPSPLLHTTSLLDRRGEEWPPSLSLWIELNQTLCCVMWWWSLGGSLMYLIHAWVPLGVRGGGRGGHLPNKEIQRCEHSCVTAATAKDISRNHLFAVLVSPSRTTNSILVSDFSWRCLELKEMVEFYNPTRSNKMENFYDILMTPLK